MAYNPEFPAKGEGYVVMDPNTGEVYPDGTYRSGALIYFGGLYVIITDGASGPPVAGDIFRVVSTPSLALGEDAGIKNFYTDEGLTNGLEYTYAVTSFDTGNPKTGLISMESSQIETMLHVVPRAQPAGYREATVEVEDRGVPVTVEPMVLAPNDVTGDQYKVVWQGAKQIGPGAFMTGPGYQPPTYEIINATTDQTVVDPQPFEWYDPGHQEAVEVLSPMFDGVILKITGRDVSYGTPDENPINNVELTAGSVSGWTVDIQSPGFGENTWPNIWWSTYYRPHRYSITFVDDTHVRVVDEDTGEEIPFSADRAEGYAIFGAGWGDTFSREDTPDYFRIYIRGGYVYIKDPNHEISAGDVFIVDMGGISAPREGDELLLTTQGASLAAEDIKAELERIRVVPNPYFITNRAVTAAGTDRIFFTRLPPQCTIRIYTLAGELVREIEHDNLASFNVDDLAQGDKGGTEAFDLLNLYNQALASGVYIYHVEARDDSNDVIGNKIGRFSIIR